MISFKLQQTTDVGDATGAKGPKVTAVNFESGFSGARIFAFCIVTTQPNVGASQ